MSRRFNIKIRPQSDFELDLAPLLAVMVKLVPVLLLSSAFVQLMIIETDIPQPVQEAIDRQRGSSNQTLVSVEMHPVDGYRFKVQKNDQLQIESVAFSQWELVQEQFEKIKSLHPEVFRIELQPHDRIDYQQIVRMMDAARRSKTKKFPLEALQKEKALLTDYMFPEVLIAQTVAGE